MAAVFCTKCGSAVAPTDTLCVNCGAARTAVAAAQSTQVMAPSTAIPTLPGAAATTSQFGSPAQDVALRASRVRKRYQDAYLIARLYVGFGTSVKIAGGVTGGFVTLLMWVSAANSFYAALGMIGGIVIGGFIAAVFYVIGVVVSAQGEILKATLDTAVNSCPFLSEDDRAAVMSLDSEGIIQAAIADAF